MTALHNASTNGATLGHSLVAFSDLQRASGQIARNRVCVPKLRTALREITGLKQSIVFRIDERQLNILL